MNTKNRFFVFAVAIAAACGLDLTAIQLKTAALAQDDSEVVELTVPEAFKALLWQRDQAFVDQFIDTLESNWRPAYFPMVLETARFASSGYTRTRLLELMTDKSGERNGDDFNSWYQWLWNQPDHADSAYADFKADLYREIDPAFDRYFRGRADEALIRFDEIRWGGVVQDGIPPLRNPVMITSTRADYLDDDNIVFGIEINGDARAYPKRILAWHEMFTDTVGGVDIAGVYCTLCGTVIPFKTNLNGTLHKLGTSGFLYRSNKLMYDEETQSLWSTSKGEPVVGPLVGKGIRLEHFGVVTTTWGEWRRRHPDTTVLSLNTGYRRDYGEGVAYNEYFATDRLMFNTPFNDDRLANKQEVLALRFQAAPKDQLAIDTEFLQENPLYTDKVGIQKILVLTDSTGANRVYDPEEIVFVSFDQDSTVVDSSGRDWQMTEEALIAPDGRRLKALPYRRAFWFGWHAAFPETRLVQ